MLVTVKVNWLLTPLWIISVKGFSKQNRNSFYFFFCFWKNVFHNAAFKDLSPGGGWNSVKPTMING